MSSIEQHLNELAGSRLTPAVLQALDFVVPGEWTNATTLDQVIESTLGVTDPAQKALIKARAVALYQSQPHYGRAIKVFKAADSFDKVAAAAVMANQVGKTFSILGVLDRFTPKPETTQAIDAALKLTAEIVAFALLRGIPVTSLTDAKAFPATLATYAKADLMRLAAWMTLDGLLPLGPEFVTRVRAIVGGIDTAILTNNALYQQIKDLLPGSSAEEQKGFVLASLDSAGSYVREFVTARGLSQEQLAGRLGSVVGAAATGMDLLAATLDGTTNYFEHTGVQSVARVLVNDARESLAADQDAPPAPPPDAEPAAAPGGAAPGAGAWFKTAAAVAAGAGAVAVGAAAYRMATDDDEDDDDGDLADEVEDENEDLSDLEGLDENAFAAREQALRMRMRGLRQREAAVAEREALLLERRRLRRARLRRMRRAGRGGPGPGRGLGRGPGRGMGRGPGRGGWGR